MSPVARSCKYASLKLVGCLGSRLVAREENATYLPSREMAPTREAPLPIAPLAFFEINSMESFALS